MASKQRNTGYESMKASWASSSKRTPSPSTRRNVSPSSGTTRRGEGSPGPATSTANAGSLSPTNPAHSPTSPRRTSPHRSPRTNRRSYGADAFSHDFVKKQSLAINTNAKDIGTTLLPTVLPEADARCSLVVNGEVWVGERDGSITVRTQDGEVRHIIEGRKGAFVWCMAAVENTVWAGCSDGFIRVLGQHSFRMEKQFSRHAGGGGGVNSLAYHVPSSTVYSGSNDFEIIAWDASTYDFIRQQSGHSNAVRALIADTHVLYSASDDCTVAVWDIGTGQKLHTWTGHKKGVHSLALTEHYLWSGSEDTTIRIWKPSGECVGVAEVHTGAVSALAVVGDRIWSGAGDTICIWDATELKLLGTYVAHDGYISTIPVLARTTQYKVWSLASDRQIRCWFTECSPDETASLKKKLERLQAVDFENRRLQESAKIREKELEEMAAKLKEAQDAAAALRERYAPMDNENQRLKEELAATKSAYEAQLSATEQANAELSNRVAQLEATLHDLQAENRLLSGESAVYKAEAARLVNDLKSFQLKMGEMNNDNDALRQHIAQLESDAVLLREDNVRIAAEMDAMGQKLREMDIIFKSRLSLITEVFKMYKRFENIERRLRSCQDPTITTAKEDFSANIGGFKSIIAGHYSDDELAHLGSSRHFFPIQEGKESPVKSPPSKGKSP